MASTSVVQQSVAWKSGATGLALEEPFAFERYSPARRAEYDIFEIILNLWGIRHLQILKYLMYFDNSQDLLVLIAIC